MQCCAVIRTAWQGVATWQPSLPAMKAGLLFIQGKPLGSPLAAVHARLTTVHVLWLGMEHIASLLCESLSEHIPSLISLCSCSMFILASYAWRALILTNESQL